MTTYATFSIEREPLSILRPFTGHPVTITVPGGGRVVLLLDDRDYQTFLDTGLRHVTGEIEVTDQMTGIAHRLTGADCGLGCRCAMRFVGRNPR